MPGAWSAPDGSWRRGEVGSWARDLAGRRSGLSSPWYRNALGLVTLAVAAICLLLFVPSAQAEWRPLSGSQCTLVGQTTCYGFYSNGNATGSPITVTQYQQIENTVVAWGDTATHNAVPSDITTQEATWGSDIETALPTDAAAGSDAAAVAGGAMDAVGTMGQWLVWSGVPQVTLGTGAFLVGWKIGSAIANFLGIDVGSGSDSTGGTGFVEQAQAVKGVLSGTALDTVVGCNGAGSGPGGCTDTHATAPSDGWLVQFSGMGSRVQLDAAGASSCGATITDLPAGAQWILVHQSIGGNSYHCGGWTGPDTINTGVYFVPVTFTAPPGQGATQSIMFSRGPLGQPSEASQLAGANSVLTNPAEDPFNEAGCAAMGPSGPCPFWANIPAPGAHDTSASYSSALAALGLNARITVVPDDEAVWDEPAGAVLWTDPLPGETVDSGSTVDIMVNPNPMPDPTETGEKDYPACDLSASNYIPQSDQSPTGLTPVTDPSLVASSTFSTSLGPTVLNYGWASVLSADPLDFNGYGYWHILAGHGWSLVDDASTRTALEDPTPRPGTNADAIDAYEFYGPEYSGNDSVTCRRIVLVEFGTAAGDPGPKGIITSYGADVTRLPLSER